jgi:hypothetical protein
VRVLGWEVRGKVKGGGWVARLWGAETLW